MQERKSLIFHIGFPKTGSSALQAFLSANVSLLEKAGVNYPNPEPQSYIDKGLCSGNVVELLYALDYVDSSEGTIKYQRDFTPLVDRMLEQARQSSAPCTLFSGEVFSQFPEEHIALLAEKTRSFDVRVVAFVRDPFDFVCSSWKQRVKRSGARESFSEDVERRTREHCIEMLDGYSHFARHFQNLQLINYDSRKKDVIGAFLETCAIDLASSLASETSAGRVYNKSLTASEANLVIQLNRTFAGTPLGALFVEHLLRQPAQGKDHFYDRATHARLLENYRDILDSINRRLPADAPLADSPREQQGTLASSEVDITNLLAFFRLAMSYKPATGPLHKLANLVRRVRWPDLPLNFDAQAYTQLNPDLAPGIDPYAHYMQIGRKEGRPYRLKGLEKGFC